MNTGTIEEILERYYEGETSLSEENTLREFFQGDDIPEHLRDHQPLFRYLNRESELTLELPAEQSEGLIAGISFESDTEQSVSLFRKRMFYLSGIAAGFLILITLLSVLIRPVSNEQAQGQLFTSSQLAYEQASQALLMVSVGLNTGLDAAEKLRTFDQAMEEIVRINKIYTYQNQFINPERIYEPSTNNQ
jgi:hypothetical protein